MAKQSDIEYAARKYRDRLLARDAGAAADLIGAYKGVVSEVKGTLAALDEKIAQAQAAGTPVTRHWLVQQAQYNTLLKQTEQAVDATMQHAVGGIIQQAKLDTVDIAAAGSRSMTEAALRAEWTGAAGAPIAEVMQNWAYMDPRAVQQMVGNVRGPGSPLGKLLSSMGPAAADALEQNLLRSVALGISSDRTARAMTEALGGNLSRALTIARTETFRVNREVQRQTYADNKDILNGWVWRSARSGETCAMCWAMDGSLFDTDTGMDTHINCRCTLLPQTKSWDELLPGRGLSSDPPDYGSGAAEFDKLSEKDKLRILGRGKYEAYDAGALGLMDLVGKGSTQAWGAYRYERSLKDVLGIISGGMPDLSAVAMPMPVFMTPRTFASAREADAWGRAHFDVAALTPDQYAQLERYSSAGYRIINGALRGDRAMTAGTQEAVAHIDAAMAKNKLPEAVQVKRGTGSSAFGMPLDDIQPGMTFNEPGYMSTGTVKGFAEKQVQLTINVPAGTPGFYMEPLTKVKGEGELLLGRGLDYTIRSSKYNSRKGKWELEVDVLPAAPPKKKGK